MSTAIAIFRGSYFATSSAIPQLAVIARALPILVFLGIALGAGCNKSKTPPLTPAQVHAITRDMQRAATAVVRPPVNVEWHPSFDGIHQDHGDRLTIRLRAGATPASDEEARLRIVQSLDRVATANKLTRDESAAGPTAPGAGPDAKSGAAPGAELGAKPGAESGAGSAAGGGGPGAGPGPEIVYRRGRWVTQLVTIEFGGGPVSNGGSAPTAAPRGGAANGAGSAGGAADASGGPLGRGASTGGAGAAFPRKAGAPRLAIVLDDLGSDRNAAENIFALKYPLTLSVLPNHAHSAEIAEEARRRGYQVMLHLPMQSVGKEKPEALELRPGMSAEQVSALVDGFVKAVPGAIGVNNHQGSQSTADAGLMAELMPVLRRNNLFYIDSRTTVSTQAFDTAERMGVRSAFRNVPFLDDVPEVVAVRKQLFLALAGAKRKGEAIAIGHPHAATLQALKEVLPQAKSQGVRVVFASELVR